MGQARGHDWRLEVRAEIFLLFQVFGIPAVGFSTGGIPIFGPNLASLDFA